MLSSSNDRLKLSRFAQKYEEDGGRVYCDERVVNNAARDRGEYVKAKPDAPRHVHELQAANDVGTDPKSRRDAEAIKQQVKAGDQAVGRRQKALRIEQAAAWQALAEKQKQQRQQAREAVRKAAAVARQKVRDEYRDQWRERHHENRAERAAFERDERTFLGRMRNRLKTIDVKGIMQSDDRRQKLGEAFGALASSGARIEQMKRQQADRDRELKARQDTAARKAAQAARAKAAV
jgi:hypothetical protein